MTAALALATNRAWAPLCSAEPSVYAETLPPHCESMLRALGLAVDADQVALICQPTHVAESRRVFSFRVRSDDGSLAPEASASQPWLDSSLDVAVWIEDRVDAAERTSHLCVVLWREPGFAVLVNFVRKLSPLNKLGFVEQDRSMLEQLRPGLSLSLRAVMDCVSSSMSTDIFRRLPFGVAMLDGERRIVFENAVMSRLLARRDSLVRHGAVLDARYRAEQEALVRSVRQIISGVALRGELIVLSREPRQQPYLATLERFDSPFITGTIGGAAQSPMVRLTVVDPDHSDENAVFRVAEHFCLTPTEIEVVQAMLLGLDVADCATHLGLAINTVRWHQKRIFAKTGTPGRSALILLFIRGSQLHGHWA